MSILKSYHINTNGSPLHINSSPTRRSSYLDILTGSPPSELATDEKDDDGACEEEAEWWYPPEDIMPRLGECCRCMEIGRAHDCTSVTRPSRLLSADQIIKCRCSHTLIYIVY